MFSITCTPHEFITKHLKENGFRDRIFEDIRNMAITKSGKKAHRQSKRRAVVNEKRSKVLKSSVKSIREIISKKDKKGAESMLKTAYKALDKAAKRGVIKKGAANRKKSRLAKAIAKIA